MGDGTILYVAQPGDYLVKIAHEHGTTWQAIWHHPLNAGHRQKRKSPDTLFVGDVLHIPTTSPEPPTPPVTPLGPPPQPPPATPPPPPAVWPYPPPPTIGVLGFRPTWACPDGTCVCHPGAGKRKTTDHTIFLHDELSRRMPHALCRVHGVGAGPPVVQTADATGAVRLELPENAFRVFVEWGVENPTPGQEPFRRSYAIDLGKGLDAVERELAHVGVSNAATFAERVYDFQLAYHLPPYDGDAASLAPVLDAYHSNGCLPPLPGEAGPEPVPPLPPDIRGPSQGAVSAVRRPNPARLRVQLVSPAEEPLAAQPFRLYLSAVERVEGVTTAAGHVDCDGIPFGDFRLELERATLFVSASCRDDPTRRTLVVF